GGLDRLCGGFLLFFLNQRGAPADALAQVGEFRASHVAVALNLAFIDAGRMHREHALDTFAVADAADGEGFVQAAPALSDDDTRENLDAFLVAFHDFGVDADGIAYVKAGRVLPELFRLNLV